MNLTTRIPCRHERRTWFISLDDLGVSKIPGSLGLEAIQLTGIGLDATVSY